MYMKPHPDPHHTILILEGGDDEVVHIRAFGKDLGIEIRVDESKTGVVISTRDGMFRQAIEPEAQKEIVKKASGRSAPGPQPPIPPGLPGSVETDGLGIIRKPPHRRAIS